MGLACGIPMLDALLNISSETLSGPVFDKTAFYLGRQCGALHFSAVYSCIIFRLLVGTRNKAGKWILPILAFLVLFSVVGLGIFMKFSERDSVHVLGFTLYGLSMRQFAQGVFSMMPTIGFVMILTPILIPSVYIARIGELFSKDLQTGSQVFDEYLKFSRKDAKKNTKISFPSQHKTTLDRQPKARTAFPDQVEVEHGVRSKLDLQTQSNMMDNPLSDFEAIAQQDTDDHPEVLLVEDDLACATLVLKFCKKIKLECIHVESLDEAQQKFNRYQHSLKILLLDNFVRSASMSADGVKTGAQWAAVLNKKYPKPQRRFHIAILSGHTHLLAELAQEADLVLQKPWDPRDLFRYLKDQQIV